MTDFIAEYERWLRNPPRRRKRLQPGTIDQYVETLRRMDRELPCGVSTCTLEELTAWIYKEGNQSTTYAYYTTIVRGFGKWATDPADPWLEFHVAEDLPIVAPNSIPSRPATEAEYRHILTHGGHWLDLFEPAALAGLRCIEISRLHREHITEQEVRVYGKGGRWRAIPTHPDLWQRFADRPRGPLARDLAGLPLTDTQVTRRGDYYLRRMGLDLSMHQLRKRFATRAYKESNHDIRLVQYLLGHALLSTTQRYLGIDTEDAAQVISRLRVAA